LMKMKPSLTQVGEGFFVSGVPKCGRAQTLEERRP